MVELLKSWRALPCKWVYKLKETSNSANTKFKAKLITNGFRQEYGFDFDEIFSPMVKMMILHFMLGIVVAKNLELIQLDVTTDFFHGNLEEEINMEQPKGFVASGQGHLVCRLKKSLYGLK